MAEAFGVSGTLLGVLGSAYFYPYALMQLPTGVLSDSWGPRKTVSTFFLLAAFGSVLMGLAPTLTMAMVGRIAVGVGVSTLFVCNFKLLAEWFAPSEFVIMGGIFMAMGGVGALSSSVPLAWVSNLIGWRTSLVGVGLVTLGMTFLMYGVVRDRPTDMGFSPIIAARREGPGSGASLLGGVRLVIRSGRLWPVSLWVFFATGISFALGGLWGGPYLMQVYGLTKMAAGSVLSMFAVALMVGSPVLSWVANRIGRKPVLISCSVVLILACSVFYGFTDKLDLPMLYGLFFCLFVAGGASGPVATTVSKELFPLAVAGSSVGTVNLFPFLGAAFFQVAGGFLVTRVGQGGGGYPVAGYRNLFLIYLLAAVISLGAALFLQETLGRTEPAERKQPD
jgi:MFS family permease